MVVIVNGYKPQAEVHRIAEQLLKKDSKFESKKNRDNILDLMNVTNEEHEQALTTSIILIVKKVVESKILCPLAYCQNLSEFWRISKVESELSRNVEVSLFCHSMRTSQ